MRTQNDIMTQVYGLILTTPINALSGDVYKKNRLTDSQLEDCVINIIPGFQGKHLQDGLLQVSIYFKQLVISNSYVEDTINAAAKETLLYNLSESLMKLPNISFTRNSRFISIISIPETHESFAILRINFQI